MHKITVTILTYNAAATIEPLLQAVLQQTLKPDTVLLIDSSSQDDTLAIAKKFPVQIHSIKQAEFGHGRTRQLATELAPADLYIFLTQDAIPTDPAAFQNLLQAFTDPKVGCAYGRQLPNKDANPLAAHARLFNYPAVSSVKQYSDRDKYGIKTCFNSDSFAAYRHEALQQVGGFPQDAAFGEDVIVAAKMLQQGWKVAYQADAQVYHSHNYSTVQEFKRYFDTGAFHANNHWILDTFNGASGEGFKYVKAEIKYCIKTKDYISLVKSLFNNCMKFVAYNCGKNYKLFPLALRKKFSMHLHY